MDTPMFRRSQHTLQAEDFTAFLAELSLLLDSGLSLHEALSLIQQGQEKPALSALLDTLSRDVRQGKKLSEHLSAYPQHFEPFLLERLRQGEQENHLHTTLADIVRYREASELADINLGRRIKAALAYPLVLLLFVLIILSFMLIFVVPVFGDMYKEFGGMLPTPTMVLIELSDITVAYFPFLLLIVLGWVLYLSYLKKMGKSIFWLNTFNHWLKLRLPGFGQIYHTLELIRCLRTWEFMLAQNASLEQALAASAQRAHISIYANILRQIYTQVAAGLPLMEAFQQQTLLPQKAGHALLIASRGHSDVARRLLGKLADAYAEKARLYFDQGSRIFTMFLVILVWLIVIFVVIALYLPIFKMGQVI
jgi:type IV pilus assembly protein PilC